MLRYIGKRMVQMVPTVFGVILLTFTLFHVVGGSPAAVVLGKNATAQSLEEFDEQRGFNRPLLFGWWTRTRAFEDSSYPSGPGIWSAMTGVQHVTPHGDCGGYVVLAGPGEYAIPLAFALRPGTRYRVQLGYRTPAGTAAEIAVPDGDASRIVKLESRPEAWETVEVVFRTPKGAPAPGSLRLTVAAGGLHVRVIRLRRGMESPFDSQFVHYMGQLARFDLGLSYESNQKVTTILRQGVWPSLALTIPMFVGGLLVSLLASLVCAYYRDRIPDRALVVAATVLMSVNYVVWVIGGQYVFAYRLGWFPIWGFESWRYLLLPVMIGMITGLGREIRLYRTLMLDEMYKDYVRTARAKGLGAPRVLLRHVLPNAMVPVITNVSMSIPFLFTGSVLLESFFGIPGLGNISVNAIHSSDMDVVRAVVLVGALLYVVVNLLTDLCYAWVDPRVRLE